jgi:hypothetical protein
MIYFMQTGTEGLVKIGKSTDVNFRIETIQSWEPSALHIIRTLDAPDWVERWLHRQFAPHRKRGEWFKFHPDMLTIVPQENKPLPQPKPKKQ